MRIIEKAKHPEQYNITELDKGEVYRLPSGGTLYIKTGACDTPYNNVNLANGVLGTISEDYKGLLKVEGAFVEDYKSEDDTDFIDDELIAKQAPSSQLSDIHQNLKKEYRNLELHIEDQERQLAARQKTIEDLKFEQNQLQSRCDYYQARYAEIEKAYKSVIKDSDGLLKQIIDAAYLGEMKGLEDAVIANPQRLIDKIQGLANTVKQFTKKDSEEEDKP